MKPIDSFSGEFHFLSNFSPSVVHYENMEFRSVEHAYQAAKSLDENIRVKIRDAKSPAAAKKMGGSVKLRADWEGIKLNIMFELLKEKFANQELRQLLLNTKTAELIEGNWWNDQFYGVCRGKGQNHLGKMLMRIREEINKQ
jgi:N-glycosidase YbiA